MKLKIIFMFLFLATLGIESRAQTTLPFSNPNAGRTAYYGDTILIKADTVYLLGKEARKKIGRNLADYRKLKITALKSNEANQKLLDEMELSKATLQTIIDNHAEEDDLVQTLTTLSENLQNISSDMGTANAEFSDEITAFEQKIESLKKQNRTFKKQIRQAQLGSMKQAMIAGSLGFAGGVLVMIIFL